MYFRCYINYMIEEKDNYKVMFYFLSPNVLLSCVFLNSLIQCIFFFRNSVLCIWLSNEGIKHQFHLSLHLWKFNFFANKGNLLLKVKYVGNVVCAFLKKVSFHNFSSVMNILLNKYFCCTVLKKTDFYFDRLPWIMNRNDDSVWINIK